MAGRSTTLRSIFARARARAVPRLVGRAALVLALVLAVLVVDPPPAAAQAVKGEVSAVVENGFARLVITLAEEVEAQVRVANGILAISFARPVDVTVDRLSANAGGYVSAARRDPDGKAVRIALARKVTVNSLAAGERLFVDLLPDTWTGLAPGLPRDVIEELSHRARDAEKKLRQQRTLARQDKAAPTRVRVVVQPTFTRYVFDLPELIGVAANNTKDKLTLSFDAMLRFDLADVKAMLPPAIQSVVSEPDHDSVLVRFTFANKVDVRTFREDNSYVVDVTPADAKNARADGAVRSDELAALAAQLSARREAPPGDIEPPPTVPARPAPAVAPALAAAAPVRTTQPAEPPAAVPAVRKRATAEAVAPPSEPPRAPAARSAAPPAHVAGETVAPAGDPDATVTAVLKRQGDALALSFPFASPTPAAVFWRADAIWLVFGTEAAISVAGFADEPTRTIKSAAASRLRDAAVVRIKLERPRLASMSSDGPTWTLTLGAEVVEPTRPLGISRNIVGPTRSSVTIPIDDPRQLHRIDDPDAGDTLLIVTALAPARGLLKSQDFVEFRALASTHGVVVQPLADDINAELAADKVIITRPTGLTLSSAGNETPGPGMQRYVLDAQSWGFDRQADFDERKSALVNAAADAPESRRFVARVDLARFYLARDLAAEAKAVLDVALVDHPSTTDDPTALVLRAVANLMIGRADAALKDLAHPTVGNQYDAPLWRALAQARQGKWADAREGFRNAEAAMGTMPIELQRVMMKDMIRAAIEVGDITSAMTQLHEFETIGIPREFEPALALLSGRLAEAMGRIGDALRAYQTAVDSWDRRASAQARLRQVVLALAHGNLKRADAIADLETLTTIWRGDETEVEGLQLLARLYTEDNRYRDAFQIMRAALSAHPNSEMTRRIQDEAAATFDSLFLAGKGDTLPAIDALALFYDYRDLTPIGRRGDEIIRRLADRLVSINLLNQAAELLQHQVDNRLQGAARAQVATRLAVVYMMNRKPDRAIATLRASRTSDLSNELRNQRLLLEARSLSDLGRHDLALEVVANIPGPEAIRLRSDVLWAAKRYAESSEQIELFYGERWQEFEPLTDTERADILRSAIGYALGEDAIGLGRFRERYAAKLGDGPDRRAFEVVATPLGLAGPEFRDIVRAIAQVDSLDSFLRDLRARYPETGALPSLQQRPPAQNELPKSEPLATGTPKPRLPPGRTAAR